MFVVKNVCCTAQCVRVKGFSWSSPRLSAYFNHLVVKIRSTHTEHNIQNINDAGLSCISGKDIETLQIVRENFKLCKNFLSEDEERSLMSEVESNFKRRRYEYDHWDGAIHGYKETEKRNWNTENQKILKILQNLAFPPDVPPMQDVHVLDLAKNGHIKPHIDSVRFCGDTIAGISMLSSCVMRLVKECNKSLFVDVLLHRRSLYIMKGAVRYEFTHEILEEKASVFNGTVIPRDRRVAIICRNQPNKDNL